LERAVESHFEVDVGMPCISIVIPVYNHAEALYSALLSISKQTIKDIEVIVVDDGSETHVDCGKQNADFDFPIQMIRQENKGAPAARNRGLQEAAGEYVIFWDADVTAQTDMLETMACKLDQHASVSFVYADFEIGLSLPGIYKRMTAQSFDARALKKNNFIHTTSLIRRKDAALWDESLERFQDWDYWLTLTEKGRQGMWIDECLFTVKAGGSMSVWLPSFAYKKPWRWLPWIRARVSAYECAQKIVKRKHNIYNPSSP
jgi:glycosyltransferase involved in cell wall biosynthesis